LGQFAFECGKVKYNVSFLGYWFRIVDSFICR
jgi:hypothetical protein